MARPNNSAPGDPADATIYALSSGAPPAAIAIVRISGRAARETLIALAGGLPSPRRASYRRIRDALGDVLDHAMLLWLPGPHSATGEDLAELHLHGGRAVVSAVLAALDTIGLRLAEPGEFTRRALFNGRLDVTAVEGLADLLAAETESQRREALRRADGLLGRKLAGWMRRLTDIAAALEVEIDYDGEEDGAASGGASVGAIDALSQELGAALAMPPAERLRDGLRVAIVGPTNAGKSSLFNALVGADAAIVSDIAGTTRDVIERPLSLNGMPIILIDTAGMRESQDPIEAIGVARAVSERQSADIVLDLGDAPAAAANVIGVAAQSDIRVSRLDAVEVSVVTGQGLERLRDELATRCAMLLPREGDVALDRRYRDALAKVRLDLDMARETADLLLAAEHIRLARTHLGGLIGGGDVEAMLDALFGRFCLGK